MTKKFPALALALVLSLCACGGKAEPSKGDATPGADASIVKIGLVCDGNEEEPGLSYGLMRGRNDAFVMLAADGIQTEWLMAWNVEENADCADANRELAKEGCQLIVNVSPGFEAFMLEAAAEYPDAQFVACGGQAACRDDLPNTHNAFANIHEARYLAGVVAGMKLQELIGGGELEPEEAVIGYVGASASPAVISGYSAYFLGARSVCPDVTMKTLFVKSPDGADAERYAAIALADMGCALISQHSVNDALATVAQSAGILHTGYENDMSRAAPEASLVSARIDWSVYLEYAVRAIANGEEIAQDWSGGLDEYAVELTPLNRDLIADGTDEKLDEVKAALADGSLQVFDASAFTVNGAALDSVPDAQKAVFDGAFHESYLQSAPYFALDIDGIEKLN